MLEGRPRLRPFMCDTPLNLVLPLSAKIQQHLAWQAAVHFQYPDSSMLLTRTSRR
jgi:hypothetical protein